jgi:hypothetical protein
MPFGSKKIKELLPYLCAVHHLPKNFKQIVRYLETIFEGFYRASKVRKWGVKQPSEK